jgi:2-polyprenyl-6-methoxyphenol hydroxylase-like FAD-dependent oxidoreductase
MASPRALIIGAGPAGLATAAALGSVGIDSVVFEQSRTLAPVGTALTLWPNALAALATFGADKPVSVVGLPAEGNQIRNSTGRLLDDMPAAEMRARFGGTGLALLRADLIEALGTLTEPGSVRTGARCVGYRTDGEGVTAFLADGTSERGDLLVGADGHRSVIRRHLLGGRSDSLRYAGYPVWRGVTRYPLGPAPGSLTMGRAAQFGLFALPGSRVYWFATIPFAEGKARAVPALPLLRERFGSWHDPIGDVLKTALPEDVIVTDIYDRPPLPLWTRGRVTLVGDAAHPSSPNLGQGTCQAFEDAATLAHCLDQCDDIPVALRRYADQRRPRADSFTRQAHRLGRLGQWQNPLACRLRDQTMAHAPRRPRIRQLERMFTFDLTP